VRRGFAAPHTRPFQPPPLEGRGFGGGVSDVDMALRGNRWLASLCSER